MASARGAPPAIINMSARVARTFQPTKPQSRQLHAACSKLGNVDTGRSASISTAIPAIPLDRLRPAHLQPHLVRHVPVASLVGSTITSQTNVQRNKLKLSLLLPKPKITSHRMGNTGNTLKKHWARSPEHKPSSLVHLHRRAPRCLEWSPWECTTMALWVQRFREDTTQTKMHQWSPASMVAKTSPPSGSWTPAQAQRWLPCPLQEASLRLLVFQLTNWVRHPSRPTSPRRLASKATTKSV